MSKSQRRWERQIKSRRGGIVVRYLDRFMEGLCTTVSWDNDLMSFQICTVLHMGLGVGREPTTRAVCGKYYKFELHPQRSYICKTTVDHTKAA